MKNPSRFRRTCHRGSILLYVVWAVMLLSLFAVGIASRALFAAGMTERLSERLRAVSLARGAVRYALLALEADDSLTVDGRMDLWADNAGLFQAHALPGGTFQIVARGQAEPPVRYGLVDEDGRLSLNTAPAEVLQRLCELAGLPKEDAEQVGASIEDWRDEDDRERQGGAETLYYRSLSNGYDCKNGPFENLEELLLIRSVSPALYHALAPHLTVYGSGLLNLNTAAPAVLQALGLTNTGVTGLVEFRAGEDNVEETADDRWLVSVAGLPDSELNAFVPVEDLARLARLADDGLIGVGSSDFRAEIEAKALQDASQVRVSCVLDRKGRVSLWAER